MSVSVMSPVQELMDQWLLLPLFAVLGMMALVLGSVRNRIGYALAALLALLALSDVAAIWPELPGAGQLGMACSSLLPALVIMFVLSYTSGGGLAGPRRWRTLALVVPAALFAGFAVLGGLPAGDPVVPIFSLVLFGAGLFLLVLPGAARSLTGNEPSLFTAALILIVGSGPVYDLALPHFGIELALFPYTSAAAGALFTHATLRYKSFFAVPAAERPGNGGGRPPPGLFITGNWEGRRARSIFAGALRAGVPGAVVTRTHPAALRRETGLVRAPVIWLANSAYERCLSPARVDVLSHIIRDMGEESHGCIVLIEDFDYLVANAGLFPTMDMLVDLDQQVEHASMTVLLSTDLLTDPERLELRGIGVMPLPRVVGVRAAA